MVKSKVPHIHYDPDPVCDICWGELNACDFGEYGEGIMCGECLYWWKGAHYYPDTSEIETREGETGKRIPWTVLKSFYEGTLSDLDDSEEAYGKGYRAGYADCQNGKPNRLVPAVPDHVPSVEEIKRDMADVVARMMADGQDAEI